MGEDLAKIEFEGEAEVYIAGRTFRVGQEFVAEMRNQPQETRIANLGKPLLILHAPDDGTVGLDNASLIFQAAKHPKSFVTLDGADHLLMDKGMGRYVATLIPAWAKRYISTAEDLPYAHPRGMVTVEMDPARSGRNLNSYLVEEPATLGGHDLGPTPYDQLLAALGNCTSITVQIYAARKKIPLQAVFKMELEHNRDHVADCTSYNNPEPGKKPQTTRIGSMSWIWRLNLLAI